MLSRGSFLAGTASALAAIGATQAIDWSFPGLVAGYARRLDAATPFATHRARTVMPAASAIKVLILLAVAREVERQGLPWSHQVTIRRADIVGASETFGTAADGERASLERLSAATIEQSDNTAANVLADWLGFAQIGRMADAAGLQQTEMRRHFMDFATRAAGIDNTTTARDMGVLLYGIARGTDAGFAGVSSAGCSRIVGFMLAQEDRETIPAGVPRAVAIANKTGELIGVRHDVAIVGAGSPDAYVVALLSSGFDDRAAAVRRLRAIAAQIDRIRGAPAAS